MTKIKVGVIGCGNISHTYLPNLCKRYENIEVIAASDLIRSRAEEAAMENNIPNVYDTKQLLADPEIQIVVNLTNPSEHYALNKQILNAGKHVYCEKPIATTLEEANELAELAHAKGLYCTGAPDTFLGAGLQTVRKLIDDGKIGRVTGFTANLCQHGSELWHPNPHFYYKKGAGPMLDMGPYYIQGLVSVMGPIDEIFCYCTCPTPKRIIWDETFDVEVDTTYAAVMKFKSGAVGTVTVSYDIWQSKLPHMEFYGDDGVIYGPDPNMFGGPVYFYDGKALESRMKKKEGFLAKLLTMHGPEKEDFLHEVPLTHAVETNPEINNMRGLGVADLASAIISGRKPRLSIELSRHVLEALIGFKISSDSGKPYKMTTTCERPDPVPAGLECWKID